MADDRTFRGRRVMSSVRDDGCVEVSLPTTTVGPPGDVLDAMEAVLSADTDYSQYGSSTLKEVHVYGRVDLRPLEIDLRIGMAWRAGGWLLNRFLASLSADEVHRLQRRVAAELTTTFASGYGAEIGLEDVLDPRRTAEYTRRGTGRKYLIVPRGPHRVHKHHPVMTG